MTADKMEFKKLTDELNIPARVKGKKVSYSELQDIFAKKIEESKKDDAPWFYWLPY